MWLNKPVNKAAKKSRVIKLVNQANIPTVHERGFSIKMPESYILIGKKVLFVVMIFYVFYNLN